MIKRYNNVVCVQEFLFLFKVILVVGGAFPCLRR
jgi:hypothetical protein